MGVGYRELLIDHAIAFVGMPAESGCNMNRTVVGCFSLIARQVDRLLLMWHHRLCIDLCLGVFTDSYLELDLSHVAPKLIVVVLQLIAYDQASQVDSG